MREKKKKRKEGKKFLGFFGFVLRRVSFVELVGSEAGCVLLPHERTRL